MAYRYDVRWRTFVPSVVNTNSARQVELTERESSQHAATIQSAETVPSRLQSAISITDNNTKSMLPPTNDRWPRTMLVCAMSMLTKIKKI